MHIHTGHIIKDLRKEENNINIYEKFRPTMSVIMGHLPRVKDTVFS